MMFYVIFCISRIHESFCKPYVTPMLLFAIPESQLAQLTHKPHEFSCRKPNFSIPILIPWTFGLKPWRFFELKARPHSFALHNSITRLIFFLAPPHHCGLCQPL